MGVNLVIDNFLYVASGTLPQVIMEILHFKDLGDTKVLSTNAVWVFI